MNALNVKINESTTENKWQNKRIIKMITNEMTSKIDEQNEYTHIQIINIVVFLLLF